MKVLAVSLAFLLITGLISTSLAENDEGGEKELVRVRRTSYNCPFQKHKCHRHCKSIGHIAGYCGGFRNRTCICVKK
ncbi:preprodefensin, putative [Ixodes scapularis]|uniref:Preprodefensin, putative n=1 Tax=Ixodes scapularis TaxID=6945 RepID=B7P452_IXOSC|nr:preprodefensin, putative [Ixodes scapularis]|eukprot:XP_002405314.1 preprodefensin, putative [Ixodes scapularis]